MNMNPSTQRTGLLTLTTLALAAALIQGCSTVGTSPGETASTPRKSLKVERYVGSAAGFLVTSNLIAGEREAILVDAQFTRADANNVVAMIKNSGKELKTVFITHGHPDHYFGVEVLQKAFPQARFVGSEDTVKDIAATGPGKLSYWKPIYKENLTDKVPQISVVKPSDLTLEGETFELRSLLPGESEHASLLVVPSLKAAFVGDLAYDEVHLWLADARQSAASWKQNLLDLRRDQTVEAIYVGHQKVPRVNSKQLLDANVDYMNQALGVFSRSATPDAAAKSLKELYPNYALPVIADISSGAWVPQK